LDAQLWHRKAGFWDEDKGRLHLAHLFLNLESQPEHRKAKSREKDTGRSHLTHFEDAQL
jgi:hypothetical protein